PSPLRRQSRRIHPTARRVARPCTCGRPNPHGLSTLLLLVHDSRTFLPPEICPASTAGIEGRADRAPSRGLLVLLAVLLALFLPALGLVGLGGGRGALGGGLSRGGRRRCLGDLGALLGAALALLDARRLARQIAQAIQLRLVDAAARHDLDLIDV